MKDSFFWLIGWLVGVCFLCDECGVDGMNRIETVMRGGEVNRK